MDLPFLCDILTLFSNKAVCFNPYSNGSSFFIMSIDNFTMTLKVFQSLF